MDIWVTLGIESTKDENAITEAYRNKLRFVHPEEHPEEFMQLRTAYDEALKLARTSEDETDDNSELGLWIAEAEKIYDNYKRRMDENEWRRLLADDICQGLDSRIDARNALLKMCMERVLLPANVWKLFDEVFRLRENIDELYERFPKGYIDNDVIFGMEAVPIVPYDLFDENTTDNPDAYINLYLKARRERLDGNIEACEATVADMERTGIKHPYTRLAQGEIAAAKQDGDTAVAIAEELKEQYPDDSGIRMFHANMCRFIKKDYEAALESYECALSVFASNQARWGKAECLCELGRLEEAKNEYLELNRKMPFNEDVSKKCEEVIKRLAEQYEQRIADEPENFELRLDYAWSCLQKGEKEKAKELIADLEPENVVQRADLGNLRTKLYINCEEYEETITSADDWAQAVELLPEGETEEEKKRKNKLGEIYGIQAKALYKLGKTDEAIKKADMSQEADPKRVDAYVTRAGIYYDTRRFDKAVEQSEKICELEPTYMSWYALACAQYELGDKQGAYSSLGKALEYGRVMQAYTFRGRILCEYGEWDAVRELVAFLTENGVPEDHPSVRYFNARIAQSGGDSDAALETYNELIAQFDPENPQCDHMWEVYYRAAEVGDDKGAQINDTLALVEKGLEIKKDYLPLLELKSYCFWKLRRAQSGIEINRHILELYPNHRYAHERIGDYLYDYYDEYEQALEHYHQQAKVLDSAALQEYIALCYMYLERYDEAEPHFRKAIEMDPSYLRARSNLGLMYERRFDFESSLEHQLECVRLDEENGNKDKNIRERLARTYARLGQHDKAIEAYKQNYELFGNDRCARKMVDMLMESGQFAEAEKLLKKLHSEGKGGERYYEQLADISRLRGKYGEYVKLLGKMSDDDSGKWLKLAEYYFDNKKYKQSQECYDRLMKISVDRMDMYYSYIRLLRETGRTNEERKLSARAFEKIGEMEKQRYQYALYLTKMAFVYLAAGQADEAKPYIDKALTAPMCDHCTYCRCKDAYIALCEYYQLKGDFKKALETALEGAKIAPDEHDFIRDIKRLKKEHKLK